MYLSASVRKINVKAIWKVRYDEEELNRERLQEIIRNSVEILGRICGNGICSYLIKQDVMNIKCTKWNNKRAPPGVLLQKH